MTASRIVAAAQLVPVPGDVAANVRRHLHWIDAAANEGVQVLLFPELSLTGYELRLASSLAFARHDARLDELRARAATAGMTVVVGAPVRLDGRLHIGAPILLPDGSVSVYTKQRLGAFPPEANPDGPVPPPEPSVFEPGELDPLVRFGGNVAAVAVCADTGLASHPRAAARRGAKTYLASMFFTPRELEDESARLSGYAREHGMCVVLANYGGPTGGLPSAGCSSIWTEDGDLLARLPAAGEGLVIAAESGGEWTAKTLHD